MPSFRPEGYSGSDESLPKASASSRGVVSTTLFSSSCWRLCWEEARESDFSFSIRLADVCGLEGMRLGARASFSMLRGSVGFVWERGYFAVGGGEKRVEWKGCNDFYSFVSGRTKTVCSFGRHTGEPACLRVGVCRKWRVKHNRVRGKSHQSFREMVLKTQNDDEVIFGLWRTLRLPCGSK